MNECMRARGLISPELMLERMLILFMALLAALSVHTHP
jgi:hypothetical protein